MNRVAFDSNSDFESANNDLVDIRIISTEIDGGDFQLVIGEEKPPIEKLENVHIFYEMCTFRQIYIA